MDFLEPIPDDYDIVYRLSVDGIVVGIGGNYPGYRNLFAAIRAFITVYEQGLLAANSARGIELFRGRGFIYKNGKAMEVYYSRSFKTIEEATWQEKRRRGVI